MLTLKSPSYGRASVDATSEFASSACKVQLATVLAITFPIIVTFHSASQLVSHATGTAQNVSTYRDSVCRVCTLFLAARVGS